jgi:hypothetical protein
MGLVKRNSNIERACARCGRGVHETYECDDCQACLCEACGAAENAAHGPEQCGARAPLERAAANEARIAHDPALDGASASMAADCRANELCPSCLYPREASAAEAKLHHLERTGQPLTKTALAGVKMSGKDAHCVLPQTLLRTQTRLFLAPLAQRSPCDLLRQPDLGNLQQAYKRHMLQHCLAPGDTEAMARHVAAKHRDRPDPQDVLRRVDALPVGVAQPVAAAQPGQTPEQWYATKTNDNHLKDMKQFISRYRGSEARLEAFSPVDQPELKLLLLELKKPDPDGDGWTVIRRSFNPANGKATKHVTEFAEYDAEGDLLRQGTLESMAKIADKSWPANVFKNLMKASLIRGNQCAYCEDLQGDFTLPQRLQLAGQGAVPEGFVGAHLIEAVKAAGGLEPYMDDFLDGVCTELAHTLQAACDRLTGQEKEKAL